MRFGVLPSQGGVEEDKLVDDKSSEVTDNKSFEMSPVTCGKD